MRGTSTLILNGADDEDGLTLVAATFPAAVDAFSAEWSLVIALYTSSVDIQIQDKTLKV